MSNVSEWVRKLVSYGKPFTVRNTTGDLQGLVSEGTQVSFSVRGGAAYVTIATGEGDQSAWDKCPLVGFEVDDAVFLVGQIDTARGPMPLLVSREKAGDDLNLFWQLDGESLAELEGAQGNGGGYNTGP